MAMTAAVKDELRRLTVTKSCCRKAEMSALLRFAGGLHIVGGRVVVEAELDTGARPGGCARTSPSCTARRPISRWSRRAACARAAGTSSGW